MQFFLANLYSERLSGSDTATPSPVDSASDHAALVAAAAADTRQPSAVPVMSGSR